MGLWIFQMKHQKKIAVFIPSFKSSGGAEKQMTFLLKGLAKRGHCAHALCLTYGGENFNLLQQDPLVKVTSILPENPSFIQKIKTLFILPFLLKRYIKKNQLDVMIATLHLATFFACLTKYIFNDFSLFLGIRAIKTQNKKTLRFLAWLTKLMSHKADGLIANSQQALDFAKKSGFETTNGFCVFNGFDSDLFYFSPEKRQDTRTKYKIKPDDFVLGTVGRLDPIKNTKFFIETLIPLLKQDPHIKIMIVGNGDKNYLNEIEALISQNALNDRIHLCGEQKDTVNYYCAFDLFILPSRSESFPNVLAEAMLCECPVIASDVGYNACLIDKKNNLFDYKNGQEICSTISQNLTSQRNPNGRKKILQNYSISSMIDAYERILSQE